MLLNNEVYDCLSLDWDSNYFGYKTAKVILKKELTDTALNEIVEICSDYQFISFHNKDNNSLNNILLGRFTGIYLVDINLQFIKHIVNVENALTRTSNYDFEITNNCRVNNQILEITKEAFTISRFTNDIRFDKNKARLVYYNWVKNSFDNVSKYFLTIKVGTDIAGYTLFKIDTNSSILTIEFIAVSELFKRKQIGKAMLELLNNYTFNNGISIIKVGTQLDNLPAVNLYLKNGYSLVEKTSIYHHWRI